MSESISKIPNQSERAARIFHEMNRSGTGIFSEALRLMDNKDLASLTPQERILGHVSLLIEAIGDARLATRVGARQIFGDEIVNDTRKIIRSVRETFKADLKPLLDDMDIIFKSLAENKVSN